MKVYHSVILTCPENSIQELHDAIQKKCPELEIIQMPLIKTEKNILSGNKLTMVHEVEWLLFTSKNAFRYFFDVLKEHQLKLNKNTKIACIGSKTATYIKQQGFPIHFIASGRTGEDFATEFSENIHATRILIPRGNLANDKIVEILRSKFRVDEIEVYKTNFTIPNKAQTEKIQQKKYDFVVFTSPSAIDAYMHHFETPPLRSVSIGPVTTSKLRRYKIKPDLEPSQPGYQEIADKLNYFYQNKT